MLFRSLGRDEQDGEPVVTLGAHGLECGSAHPRVGRREFEEAAHALHIGIAIRVENGALPHHIVDDDERSPTREFYRPLEVARGAGLVGVDKDEIERTFRRETRQ